MKTEDYVYLNKDCSLMQEYREFMRLRDLLNDEETLVDREPESIFRDGREITADDWDTIMSVLKDGTL